MLMGVRLGIARVFAVRVVQSCVMIPVVADVIASVCCTIITPASACAATFLGVWAPRRGRSTWRLPLQLQRLHLLVECVTHETTCSLLAVLLYFVVQVLCV